MNSSRHKPAFLSRLQAGENARMAFSTLRTHKTRSFLTVLGVVIGVTALIAVGSIVVGLDRDVRAFLEDYGTNTLFVFRWDIGFHVGRRSQEERMRKPLSYEDMLAIQTECPSVMYAAAFMSPNASSTCAFETITPSLRITKPVAKTDCEWRRFLPLGMAPTITTPARARA